MQKTTIKLKTFGRIAEIVGFSDKSIEDVRDTQSLLHQLHQLYPDLTRVKCLIAINKKQVHENTVLNDQDEVALMPPFSGG